MSQVKPRHIRSYECILLDHLFDCCLPDVYTTYLWSRAGGQRLLLAELLPSAIPSLQYKCLLIHELLGKSLPFFLVFFFFSQWQIRQTMASFLLMYHCYLCKTEAISLPDKGLDWCCIYLWSLSLEKCYK